MREENKTEKADVYVGEEKLICTRVLISPIQLQYRSADKRVKREREGGKGHGRKEGGCGGGAEERVVRHRF